MIKNNTTANQQNEELFMQQTLQEIKSMKNKKKANLNKKDSMFEICNYQGVDYFFPKKQSKYSTFTSLKISSAEEMLDLSSHTIFINKDSFHRNQIILTLENDNLFIENTGIIYVYRKGESSPIAHQEQTEYNTVDFIFHSDIFSPGEYFFVISNLSPNDINCNEVFEKIGDHYIYPFSVYAKGEQIELPCIKLVESEVRPNPTVYSNTPLLLTLRFKNSIRDLVVINAVCIDENNSIVSTCTIVPTSPRVARLYFEPKLLWQAGRYSILLQINEMPFYKISFDITDSEDIKFYWELTIKFSDEYLLCKTLLNKSNEWKNLQEIYGINQLKMAIKNYIPLVEVNNHRDTKCPFNHNFTIANDYVNIKPILKDFSRCISNKDYRFEFKKCNKLGKPNEQAISAGTADEEYEIEIEEGTCLCLYEIQELSSPYSIKFVDNLIYQLNNRINYSMIMIGSEKQINAVFETHPRLKGFFPKQNQLKTEPLTAMETIECLFKNLNDRHIDMLSGEKIIFVKNLLQLAKQGRLKRLTEGEIAHFVNTSVISRYTERIRIETCRPPFGHYIARLEAEDIDLNLLTNYNDEKFDYAAALNKMIGLNTLKESLEKMFNLTKFNQIRHSFGLKAEDNGCHHMLFTGNPGTGKTTVAKLIGKVFHSIGVLSKGDVIITERSKIVGRYLGETEQNMNELLNQARGNVLFIDEAYTLSTDADDHRDFGKRVIETLLTVLSQKNPDMIIILAGYEKEISKMLSVNPGLNGRFPHHFKFDDYSAEELMLIAESLIKDEQYILTPEAHSQLNKTIIESVNMKDSTFSNARWVNQYVVNGIIPEVANRLIQSSSTINQESCQTITLDDVNTAYENYKFSSTKNYNSMPRVGFKTT